MYPYSAKSGSLPRLFKKCVNHFAFSLMFSFSIELKNPKWGRLKKINREKIMPNFPQTSG